jgi:hypothetical protein
VQAGTLQLTGDAAGDTLVLAQDGATTLGVVVNDQLVASFDRSTFTAVAIDARGGNDTVRILNMSPALENVTIDGGAGDDTLIGANGAETLIGNSGNDFVDGNIGADSAQLGSGNDTFQWDPGDGSDTVDGQSGKDALAFNGSNIGEKIDLAADGSHVRLHGDIAGITTDLDGIESTTVRALGSADTVTVGNLAGTDLATTNVDLNAITGDGDGAGDTVVVNGSDRAERVRVTRAGSQVLTTGLAAQTTIAGSEPTLDTLRVNTLGGRDDVQVAPDVNALIAPVVDLGADQ